MPQHETAMCHQLHAQGQCTEHKGRLGVESALAWDWHCLRRLPRAFANRMVATALWLLTLNQDLTPQCQAGCLRSPFLSLTLLG